MEKPMTFRTAMMGLESELNDARNMAKLAAFVIEEHHPDRDVVLFATYHTAELADKVVEKWSRLLKEASEQKAE